MEQLTIPIQKPYNSKYNIPNNFQLIKNNIYHGKSTSYSGIPNTKQIIINPIQNNQYNFQNKIGNNYYNNYNNYNIRTEFDANSDYNKYNVTNNFYGNQIINNNINYYPSSRNVKELKNINNQGYNNNNYINVISQPNMNNYFSYNDDMETMSYNKVVQLNPNLNLKKNLFMNNNNNNNYNNYIAQTPKSGMKFIKRNKSKEKVANIIKNIDVNLDYQENNVNINNISSSNRKKNYKNKKNIKILDDDNDNDNDNISYFDLSNLKKRLTNMNSMKVMNNSNMSNNNINTNENINNINTSRKSSKVKNKMISKIPYNYIKKINNYNSSNAQDKNYIKYNSSNSKKTMSKIPINMKRKTIEIKNPQNDEESEMNEKLYNTNAFSNKNILNNYNDELDKKNEKIENKIYKIYNNKELINKDNNLDDISENYKSIKSIKPKSQKFKTSTESDEAKTKFDFISINTTTTHYINNEDLNKMNIEQSLDNQNPYKKNKKVKNKKLIIQHSKAKTNIVDKPIVNEINEEKEINKEDINNNIDDNEQIEEYNISDQINSVKIDKIESKLINKKIQIKKDKKLNNSQSNDTMNVSEMSNDDKIMKINNFTSKIRNNIIKDIDNNKDFNATKKIQISKNNNIIINDIIINNKKITSNKDIKNIQYISKLKKNNKKDNKKEEYIKEKNYFKRCKYKSIAGKDSLGNRKINQDLYLIQISFLNIEGFNLFGVLDGHGEYGHKVAIFTRDFILSKLTSFFKENKYNSLNEIYELLKKDNFAIIKNIYQQTDKELYHQNFNSNFSGSTCIIVFQVGDKLICANVGDSRAILINSYKKDDQKLTSPKIYELSHDQKPELPEEKKRIYKMGGVVDQMLDSKGKRNGPFRVWAGKNNYPGLSMSRCIGDLKGKKCGLISEPIIIEYTLDERSKYMVICSDGVWEFLDNEDVMRMGIEFYVKDNIEEFLEKIIKVSEFWWEKEDIIRDDITAIVVFF